MTASFKYDALNRKIEKTVNGRTIQYLYDNLDIVQETESGVVTVNYIRSLNIDEPLARVLSDGTIRYYQADALGSVIALTDDLGNIKTQYNYSPFGETEISGEISDNPFQYTGRENDGTGLYYYRARYYSPRLKRFVSEDPIGFAGGINMFVYVGNSPINKIDPFGLYESGDGPNPPSDGFYGPMPEWPEPNPNGLACSAVCGLGKGLMCTSIGLATGGYGGLICNVITTPACPAICPPLIKPKCPK